MQITPILVLPLALTLSVGTLPAKDKSQDKPSRTEKKDNADKTTAEKNWKRATEGHRPQDLNGDGVITRNEWPGNDVSFRELDRDGDGALTNKDRDPGAEGTSKRMDKRRVTDDSSKKKP